MVLVTLKDTYVSQYFLAKCYFLIAFFCEIILRDSLRNIISYFVKYCLMTPYLDECFVIFIVIVLINFVYIP